MARDLTIHESIIRKALPAGTKKYSGDDYWTAYPDGYEVEAVRLTEEEAGVVDAATTLVLCFTCSRVIEDGDRQLEHRFRTYCEPCGTAYLESL